MDVVYASLSTSIYFTIRSLDAPMSCLRAVQTSPSVARKSERQDTCPHIASRRVIR